MEKGIHKHSKEHEDRMDRKDNYDLNNTNFHELDHMELTKCAEKHREIDDLEERLDTATKIMVGYQKSPFIGHVYRERARDIDSKDLDDLADEVHEFFDKKKDTLNYNEQMKFFKKLANIVGPPMYIGSEDTLKENWKHLEVYLKKIKTSGEKEKNERGEPATRMDDVRWALEVGDVVKAKQIIVDSLIEYNMQRDEEEFLHQLIPPDDQDYWQEIAEPIAARYNKELKRAGRGKKAVTPQQIAGSYERISKALGEIAGQAIAHEKLAAKRKYIKSEPPEE